MNWPADNSLSGEVRPRPSWRLMATLPDRMTSMPKPLLPAWNMVAPAAWRAWWPKRSRRRSSAALNTGQIWWRRLVRSMAGTCTASSVVLSGMNSGVVLAMVNP